MDFKEFSIPQKQPSPIDPIKIFEKLPSLPGTPNDLWRGQTSALQEWNENRKIKDLIISLNTGAGKTLVGLLIAKSLVNEGLNSVLYLCSTIDLVNQTYNEAQKIGIDSSIRIKGQFNNDLFETSKSFCITTYSAFFNSLSHIARYYIPEGIIFDDAHVAEKIIRDSFTLKISRYKYSEIFDQLTALFKPTFEKQERVNTFLDVIEGVQPQVLLVSPSEVLHNKEQLSSILRNGGLNEDSNLKYAYNHLKDHLSYCTVIFGSNGIEIAPPFIPTGTLNGFQDNNVRRIYLSATLNYQSDFVRAFGRIPEKIIEPNNDAGNGERLILFDSLSEIDAISSNLLESILDEYKLIIAVPSYRRASFWEDFGSPPTTDDFTKKLNEFRDAEEGCFVLVSRVDGIDLPYDTCRIMLIDDLPTGQSYLERFQVETLRMNNLHSSKIANRIVQLFGRINRGRNDYGVFLLKGRNLNTWLKNERNLSYLPELLQKQVLLGQHLGKSSHLESTDQIIDITKQVLSRDEEWIKYYSRSIDALNIDKEVSERASLIEKSQIESALNETQFMSSIWNGKIDIARSRLSDNIEDLSRSDSRLAGWHNLWISICHKMENDIEAAEIELDRAIERLPNLGIRKKNILNSKNFESTNLSQFEEKILNLLLIQSEDSFNKQLRSVEAKLNPIKNVSSTSSQQEEAIRELGLLLGFSTSRPDNDEGTGPDIFWFDAENNEALAIELKNDKKEDAVYFKKDISQSHDHIQWVKDNYQESILVGLLLIGPNGKIQDRSNPSDEMYLTQIEHFQGVVDTLLSTLKDVRKKTPIERQNSLKNSSLNRFYSLDKGLKDFFISLKKQKLKKLEYTS